MKTQQKIKEAIEKNSELEKSVKGKRGVLAQKRALTLIEILKEILGKTEEQIKEVIEENTKKAEELESDKGVLAREEALTNIDTLRWALRDKD